MFCFSLTSNQSVELRIVVPECETNSYRLDQPVSELQNYLRYNRDVVLHLDIDQMALNCIRYLFLIIQDKNMVIVTNLPFSIDPLLGVAYIIHKRHQTLYNLSIHEFCS